MMTPQLAISLVWLVWWISWMVAATWSNRVIMRPSRVREFPYTLATLVGICLLFGFYPHRHLHEISLWHLGRDAAWAMVAIAALGFLFAWWARVHLGRLWSRGVTRKEDHHVVNTGPYSLVRHPIYTGIILTTIATATMHGTALACLGASLLILGWYIKARLEESFLREQLGAEAYDTYARRVPMLLPMLRF
jgi:protein-S-isoprenylcysteine O-methyltransferase Ste14